MSNEKNCSSHPAAPCLHHLLLQESIPAVTDHLYCSSKAWIVELFPFTMFLENTQTNHNNIQTTTKIQIHGTFQRQCIKVKLDDPRGPFQPWEYYDSVMSMIYTYSKQSKEDDSCSHSIHSLGSCNVLSVYRAPVYTTELTFVRTDWSSPGMLSLCISRASRPYINTLSS